MMKMKDYLGKLLPEEVSNKIIGLKDSLSSDSW